MSFINKSDEDASIVMDKNEIASSGRIFTSLLSGFI